MKNISNALTVMLFIFILFDGIYALSLKKDDNADDSKKTSKYVKIGEKGFTAAGYAQTCLGALASSIPPRFCFKKGADFGVIPTGCPNGYYRSLALCYEYCRPGYYVVLGVCWAKCGSGYHDHGATCFKHLFKWYFKSTYIPKSLTNFSSSIPCPGAMYKSGALCYRNCSTVGMANCGIGACSSDSGNCLSEIGNMLMKIGEGLFTAITTLVTFGTSVVAKNAAKLSIKAAVKTVGKAALKSAFKAVKKALTGGFAKFIKKKAFEKVKDSIKDGIKDKVKALAVSTICSKVWEGVTKKTVSVGSLKDMTDTAIDTVDVLGIKGIVSSCGDVKSDAGLGCAKGVVDAISNFDPTGILSIVSAFMQPVCDVPTYKPSFVMDTIDEFAKTYGNYILINFLVPIPTGWIQIKSNKNFCIHSFFRRPIYQGNCNSSTDSLWKLEINGENYFIINKNGFVIDVESNYHPVYSWIRYKEKIPSQQWKIKKIEDGYFMLENAASGKCLDNFGTAGEGIRYIQTDCISGSLSQRFSFA